MNATVGRRFKTRNVSKRSNSTDNHAIEAQRKKYCLANKPIRCQEPPSRNEKVSWLMRTTGLPRNECDHLYRVMVSMFMRFVNFLPVLLIHLCFRFIGYVCLLFFVCWKKALFLKHAEISRDYHIGYRSTMVHFTYKVNRKFERSIAKYWSTLQRGWH